MTETIYIPLLDEGTTVSRPTEGEPLGNGVYRVLPTSNYDPEDEVWQFTPGSIVVCKLVTSSSGSPFLKADHLYTTTSE